MTYRLVKNQMEQQQFLSIAQGAWEGEDWYYEDLERSGRLQYLISNDKDEVIGTFELLPYIPEGMSLIERDYPFYNEKEVRRQTAPVYELDKLSIAKENRSNEHLYILMRDLMLVGKNELESELFLSLIRPSFFRLLTRIMKLPITGLTDPIYCDENDDEFVPCLCYVPKNETELAEMYASMRRGLRLKSITK